MTKLSTIMKQVLAESAMTYRELSQASNGNFDVSQLTIDDIIGTLNTFDMYAEMSDNTKKYDTLNQVSGIIKNFVETVYAGDASKALSDIKTGTDTIKLNSTGMAAIDRYADSLGLS